MEWPLTAIDGAVSLMVCLTPASVRLKTVSVLLMDETAEGDMTAFVMTKLKVEVETSTDAWLLRLEEKTDVTPKDGRSGCLSSK